MFKVRKLLSIALVTLFFASGSAIAKSPLETAKDYFNLLKQQHYNAVAGYYDPATLAEFRQLMNFQNEMPAEKRQAYFQTFFSPALTEESAAKLSDSDFFASFLRGVLSTEKLGDALRLDNLGIIGEVMEGEDVAHVVVRNRLSVGETDIESIEVITFKKTGDEWKVQMSGKLKGIALTLRWELTHRQ